MQSAKKPTPEQIREANLRGIRAELPWLHQATMNQALTFYDALAHDPGCTDEVLAELGRGDRFFLLTHLLHRPDAIHPWLYARCREVEQEPDGHLDLWARDHYKSTVITFAGSIQEILKNPEITIGIFSHSRPIAKAFLNQIKQELERNQLLVRLYPDALWEEPSKEAPSWSLDGGIVVRRKSNPKEMTVEAWGLVDGQPIGKHFQLLIFDDVVVRDSVNTPDQITKTTEAWELAQNLGSSQHLRKWHIGTRYNYADTYAQLLKREAVKPRVYPATDTGTPDGRPVFLPPDVWAQKKKESSAYTIACQQLQNPQAGNEQELKPEWIRRYELRPRTLNVYILFDYAGSRASTGSSKTAMAVIGIDSQFNKYVIDGAVHKMDLRDRWELMKATRKKWLRQPGVQVVKVGYERFGAQSDIQHFEEMMRIEGEAFEIVELNWPRDGDVAKDNRIRRLAPDLENWRFFFPYDGDQTSKQREAIARGEEHLVAKPIKRKNEEERLYDVVQWVIDNEYLFFPNTTQKDWLDAASRIYDIEPNPPLIVDEADVYPEPED